MPSQRNQTESFRFKLAAFYQGLKSKVGLAAAKAAALRINLNIQGCSIVAAPMHAPSRTGLGSSSLVAHVVHIPPPPHANSFVLGPAVIKTHILVQSSSILLLKSQPKRRFRVRASASAQLSMQRVPVRAGGSAELRALAPLVSLQRARCDNDDYYCLHILLL